MTVPRYQTGPRGGQALPWEGNEEAGALHLWLQSPEAREADPSHERQESAGNLTPIPRKLTAWGCGVPYHEAQLKESPGPQVEAAGVLVEVGVPGQWVGSGQTAPEGAPASP